ncbi:MAG: bacitracin transporter ATP-binding protein [Clostridiaceae bacterium]|jgi:ABC-2 type transport system ATP-binding protein|nr:bacitracin transporter ATP-binding protein [Clostridiaceae bacterium]
MDVLRVDNVYKRLGKREIIKGISFSVKEGEIFGFLGPNGAGKTTTIRMLVGLISPNKGTISIMGKEISKEREAALKEVGAVVENPELYTYLSGRENLNQIAAIRKIPKDEISKIIKLVGLENRIDDRVKKYSLGMKQRLGLGAALLSNPKLLILDEPTNGLDPSGIMDFRQIVKKAAAESKTSVFISSHILSEVQQVCDTVAFIDNGVIKSIESISGNNNINGTDTLVLRLKEMKNSMELLKSLDIVVNVKQDNENIIVNIKKDSSPDIIASLVNQNIAIVEAYIKHEKLEDRYMELVEGGRR